MPRGLLTPGLLLVLFADPATRADPPSDADVRFFETKVRPVLVAKCYGCHGQQKQKSGLRLDTADGLRRGGATGEPLVVAGKPGDGLLLRAVRHAGGAPKMPPDGRLTDAEITALTAWVKRGAPYPLPVTKSEDDPAKHWAFVPVKPSAVPPGRDPIDYFIRKGLSDRGLSPAPSADRRTLIRRATFDLTGLPPTPEEVDAFLKDDSPDAFATVVDRLLGSSAYGERWGRHWLDVARYADSNGLDENVAHGNAWRYRDYVIRAFNADKPYDRFLIEQVAGDLLPAATPAERHDHLIATGFLALGPKVLAEPDEKKMELDLVDEQVDTLGRAVLGMTLGCARCHDHKFDPVSTDDYYGLAGIFVSTRTMETFKKVARWHENPLATPAEQQRKAAHDATVARLKAVMKAFAGRREVLVVGLRAALARLEAAAPDLPSAMGVTEGTVAGVPVLRRGDHLRPGAVVPRRFPAVLAGRSQSPLPPDHSGRLELARWLTHPNNPLTARVMVNRIWRWHFGAGIVRSVDNFGLLGEKPSHPDLLDRLAADFVRSGWSVKALHRRIILSEAYRRSSTHDPKSAVADPENRLLWRANVRRLEAEAIRDSLLAVSGRLDRTAGGPALTHVKNRGYLFDHTSKDLTTYDTTRRSVYLPVIRNNLYDVFQLFDATDATVPGGDRPTTTVATQALFFLNAGLVGESADALAARLLAAPGDDAGRVRALYALAYGRPPSRAETDRLTAAVDGFVKQLAAAEPDVTKRERRAWALVCHAILASNEFVTIN
jgi:hypothetical protein